MRYIYICGAIPEKDNNEMMQSVAGNKFSINMVAAFDRLCDGMIDVISTANGISSGGEYLTGKVRLSYARRKGGFVLSDCYQTVELFRLLKKLRKKHRGEELTVIVENAPFAVMIAVCAFKKLFGCKAFSIVIDTPFTRALKTTGVKGRINKFMFKTGQRLLRCFDGLVSFTEDVEKELSVSIPFHRFAIGCCAEKIEPAEYTPDENCHRVVYAGTLIYYNGIESLLSAFEELGKDYQLHIYGYGPLEEEVRRRAGLCDNIFFHGRFSPEQTADILQQYDAAINPRMIDPYIENFTFPSKLIDYILSYRPVLSTRFKTMPEEYGSFLYLIDDVSKEAVSSAVTALLADSVEARRRRISEGTEYVLTHQTYSAIAQDILAFFKNT